MIFGHGFGDSRFGGPTAVGPTLARAVSRCSQSPPSAMATVRSAPSLSPTARANPSRSDGRRRIDLNSDGVIEPMEGCNVISPVPYGLRDCFRQTAVDLMQLVRVLRQGLDLDGDGVARPRREPRLLWRRLAWRSIMVRSSWRWSRRFARCAFNSRRRNHDRNRPHQPRIPADHERDYAAAPALAAEPWRHVRGRYPLPESRCGS